MYRQNQLKEELDRLRKEKNYLEYSNALLKERINTLQTEIRALRLELQNRDLMGRLINEITLKPRPVIIKDKEE